MSDLKAVQTIADDQTEVSSKLQTLINNEEIDADEIKSVSIAPFGISKFVIVVVYALAGVKAFLVKLGLTPSMSISLNSVRSFSNTLGLSPVLSYIKTFSRSMAPKLGLNAAFSSITSYTGRVFSPSFGLTAIKNVKKGKSISSTFGMTCSMDTAELAYSKSFTPSAGLNVHWEAALNGVEIELGY